MRDPKVLASAALFRELYDNNKDIYDVIAEFIRTTVLLKSTWVFNLTDCTANLKSEFGFEIPEAIVKSCLKSKLVRSGEFTISHGIYSATEKFDKTKSIQEVFESARGEYAQILTELVSHVKRISVKSPDEEKLKSSFNDYLLDDQRTNEYSSCISHFILQNESNDNFKEKLNRIEEGLVLYTGIINSGDLSTLGHWRGNLTIFLDTEHLFSAVGFNGVIHKKVFDDFYRLIKDVNSNKKNGKISLRYFSETEDEVNNFFYAAENVLEDKKQVDPSKTAMVSILNGSKSKSEIVFKKTKFYNDLKNLKIQLEEPYDYYKNTEYNIESQAVIESLERRFNDNYEAQKCAKILRKFTKINCLRKGNSNPEIEDIPSIFMTENRFTQAVSRDEFVLQNGDTPFATNVDFITETLWFKLNKGFSTSKGVPASFDIVTRAKLVLSSQLNNAVADTYRDLKSQHKEGKLSHEEAALLISELRGRPSKPEDFTPSDIDDSIDFISSEFIENTLRERSVLQQKSREGEEYKRKVKEYERAEKVKQNSSCKTLARLFYRLTQVLLFVCIPGVILCLFVTYSTEDNTVLWIIFEFFGLVLGLAGVIKIKQINITLWRVSKSCYRKCLTMHSTKT